MIGVVTGVFLGGVGTSTGAAAGFATSGGDGAAESDDTAVAALVDAATRCKALPSFLNFVIKFCKCNWAEGRVM